MAERDLREVLREVDHTFGERGLPSDVDTRLRARLADRGRPAGARHTTWALAAAMAALAAVVVVVASRPASPVVGTFVITERSTDLSTRAAGPGVRVLAGRAELEDAARGVVVEVVAGVELEPTPRGLRLASGRVDVDVDAALVRTEPWVIAILDHTITTIGARFVVERRDDVARVEVVSGRVEVDGPSGARGLGAGDVAELGPPAAPRRPETSTATTAPAQREAPPREPAPREATQPEPAPREATQPEPSQRELSPRPRPAPPELSAVLERLDGLRARRRWPDAIAMLRAALDDRYPLSTRERLSFELATLVSEHGGDSEGACAEWARHLSAFGRDGRYTREVDAARARLGCRAP